MKKRSPIYLFLPVLLVGIVLLVVFYVVRNLDSFIQAAIESYGSEVAGVPITVKKVKFRLREGTGSIGLLSVSNPRGFSGDPIFEFEDIRLNLVPDSSSETSVIREIRIQSPRYRYEVNESREINLEAIRENLQEFALKQKDERGSGTEKSPVLLRVESLVLESGMTVVDFTERGGERLEVPAPRIEMRDIGGDEGVTPEHLAQAIFSSLVRELEAAAEKQAGGEREMGGGQNGKNGQTTDSEKERER